jgi:hypothetical protein
MDCGVDPSFGGICHVYEAYSHVWLKAVPDAQGELCLDCLQVRLGRSLTAVDFRFTPHEMFMRMWPDLEIPHQGVNDSADRL